MGWVDWAMGSGGPGMCWFICGSGVGKHDACLDSGKAKRKKAKKERDAKQNPRGGRARGGSADSGAAPVGDLDELRRLFETPRLMETLGLPLPAADSLFDFDVVHRCVVIECVCVCVCVCVGVLMNVCVCVCYGGGRGRGLGWITSHYAVCERWWVGFSSFIFLCMFIYTH
jgi:hypothetical protein